MILPGGWPAVDFDRLEDSIEEQRHHSLGWLLRVHFFLVSIPKQNSYCRFVRHWIELSVCCFYSAPNDNHKSFPSIIPLILFLKRVVYLSNTYELLFFSKIKGGVQSGGPQPNVIIPSAAFGGSIISFVLCPSELVKVSELESYLLHSIFPYKQLLPILCLWHWASQCRMQVQGTDSLVPKSVRYTSPLDCALRTVKQEGVSKSLTYCILKHMYHLELMD